MSPDAMTFVEGHKRVFTKANLMDAEGQDDAIQFQKKELW